MTKFQLAAAGAILMAGSSLPASAERACSVTLNAVRKSPQGASRLAAGPGPALAKAPAAIISGGGQGLLTDPDGETFSHQFAISAIVHNDGSAKGKANFVFSALFSRKWGAVPGVDLIQLKGDITAGAAAGDGKIELTGPFVETDFTSGEGIVYQEDSRVSGSTPLKIVVTPGLPEFTISWCDFIPPNGTGSFGVQVTSGNLKSH
jgi:hypothetical protein